MPPSTMASTTASGTAMAENLRVLAAASLKAAFWNRRLKLSRKTKLREVTPSIME